MKDRHDDTFERSPEPWGTRDDMGEKLWNAIQGHPKKGQWKEGYPATSLMTNAASHPDGSTALRLVVKDIIQAEQRGAPIDVVRLAVDQAIEWRGVMLETQPSTEQVFGSITMDMLKQELQGRLSKTYYDALFG